MLRRVVLLQEHQLPETVPLQPTPNAAAQAMIQAHPNARQATLSASLTVSSRLPYRGQSLFS